MIHTYRSVEDLPHLFELLVSGGVMQFDWVRFIVHGERNLGFGESASVAGKNNKGIIDR